MNILFLINNNKIMELNLEQVLAGKDTQIKGKSYFNTDAYVSPFIEKMSKYTDNFIYNGVMPDQMTLSEGNTDVTWNRMWIQAVMPDENGFDNHSRVVGMVYGLDIRKPVVKFYVGGLNMACCNLCVFSPSFLDVQELEPDSAINYKPVDRLLEQVDNVRVTLEKLRNTTVDYNEVLINENLGDWVRKTLNSTYSNQYSKVKLATSTAIDAYKLLYENEDSPYYVPKDTSTDMFNIYNAWTQVITNDKRDIINKAEKTLLIGNILGI